MTCAEKKKKGARSWLEFPDLATYAGRLALANLAAWLVLFGLAFGGVFYWMNVDGWIGWRETLALCAWSGFFAGLVSHYSASLQTRRALLLGILRPTEAECRRIADGPARNLAGSFWRQALFCALWVAVAQTLVMLLLSSLGDKTGYRRGPYLFYTALLPAAAFALVSQRSARRSAERFISARCTGTTMSLSAGRYFWLHNVLPYALISSAVGLVTAFGRFRVELVSGQGVPAESVALHYALTVLIVCLLLPAVAGFKTRVDLLSPIELVGELPGRSWPRYRYLLAPVLAGVIYCWLRWMPGVPVNIAAPWVVAGKVGLCLVSAGLSCSLSVAGVVRERPHPYFELSRRLHQARRRFLNGAGESLFWNGQSRQ